MSNQPNLTKGGSEIFHRPEPNNQPTKLAKYRYSGWVGDYYAVTLVNKFNIQCTQDTLYIYGIIKHKWDGTRLRWWLNLFTIRNR